MYKIIVVKSPPYIIKEKGWGGFIIKIVIKFTDGTDKQIITDLNFDELLNHRSRHEDSYYNYESVEFLDPSQEIFDLLMKNHPLEKAQLGDVKLKSDKTKDKGAITSSSAQEKRKKTTKKPRTAGDDDEEGCITDIKCIKKQETADVNSTGGKKDETFKKNDSVKVCILPYFPKPF